MESNVYSTVTSQNLGTDELFLKYPELRPYFYGGKQLNEDDPHSTMALAAAEYLLDNYDSQMMQLKKYPGLWRSRRGPGRPTSVTCSPGAHCYAVFWTPMRPGTVITS